MRLHCTCRLLVGLVLFQFDHNQAWAIRSNSSLISTFNFILISRSSVSAHVHVVQLPRLFYCGPESWPCFQLLIISCQCISSYMQLALVSMLQSCMFSAHESFRWGVFTEGFHWGISLKDSTEGFHWRISLREFTGGFHLGISLKDFTTGVSH